MRHTLTFLDVHQLLTPRNKMMTTKRSIASLILFFLVGTFSPVWAHEGVIHGEGLEIHPRLEILRVGPDGRFLVSIAQLPDAPLTGENVQFLIRLEESLAIDDPLLGGQTPFLTESLQVQVTREDGSSYPLEVSPEEAEEGGCRDACPEEGEGYCAGISGLGGRDDWRMPNKAELFSAAQASPPWEQLDQWLWTLDTDANVPDNAWSVNLADGGATWGKPKEGVELPVRCVSGP